MCQVLFTVSLLWLLSFRNFVVGTTLSKLETVIVAFFGLLLLGDKLSPAILIAVAMSSLGLMVLSAGQVQLNLAVLLSGMWRQSTLIGLSCAAWLGLSVVFFRAASLSLSYYNFLISASLTLLVALILQTLIMGIVIALREPGQLRQVIRHWRPSALVGISGGLASIGWFSAFTLQNATYVRALGQIELIFTFIATILFFNEKVTRSEVVGIFLISIAIPPLIIVTTVILLFANGGSNLLAGGIVHDGEFEFLRQQHGEQWDAEDKEIDQMLATSAKRMAASGPTSFTSLLMT